MTEMIEKVARALYAYENGGPEGWDGPLMQERGREMWRRQAHAAIEAMREPTEAMANAAECAEPFSFEAMWQAAIAAALSEPKGE